MCKCISISLFLEPSIKKKMCVYQGKSHEIGKTFVSADCKGQCSCHEKGKGFEIRCVSLCPPMMVRCKSNEIMKHVDIPIHPGSKCTCNRPVCEAGNIACSLHLCQGFQIDMKKNSFAIFC